MKLPNQGAVVARDVIGAGEREDPIAARVQKPDNNRNPYPYDRFDDFDCTGCQPRYVPSRVIGAFASARPNRAASLEHLRSFMFEAPVL